MYVGYEAGKIHKGAIYIKAPKHCQHWLRTKGRHVVCVQLSDTSQCTHTVGNNFFLLSPFERVFLSMYRSQAEWDSPPQVPRYLSSSPCPGKPHCVNRQALIHKCNWISVLIELNVFACNSCSWNFSSSLRQEYGPSLHGRKSGTGQTSSLVILLVLNMHSLL